jgi:hypothetical protein
MSLLILALAATTAAGPYGMPEPATQADLPKPGNAPSAVPKPANDGAQPPVVQNAPVAPLALAATSSITVYKPDFFAAFAPNTALDMIGRVPGFSYDGGDNVRGFAGAASNVLIDGRRVASKSDGTDSVLNRIPAKDVERIELIRGGAPGIDMQGRTVMVNVVRKAGDATSLVLSASDNLFLNDGHTIPGGKIEFSKRVGAQTFEASLTRYQGYDDSVGNGRFTTVPTSGPVTSETARTQGNGGGVGATANYKGPLFDGDFRANFKLEESYFHADLDYEAPADDNIIDRNRQRDGEIGVNWDRKFGAFNLELVGLQHLERDNAGEVEVDPTDVTDYGQIDRSGESILRATLRYTASPTLSFETGGEGAYNFLVGHERYSDNGVDIPQPSADVTVSEKRGEVFGSSTWKINPKLTLEAGARFEFSEITETGDAQQDRTFFYPKPRALLTWDPYKDTEIRLRVEKKVGQLDFTQFVSSADLTGGTVKIGNPNLRPDQRWQYEAALEQRFWGKGSVVITALHEQITDVTDYIPIATPDGPEDAPGNIGNGTSDQIDIETNIPLDPFGLKGGLLKTSTIWRVSDVTDPVTHQSRRISGQRPNALTGEYDQDLPQWKSNFGLTYFNGWKETYYRLAEIDRFHIGDQFIAFFYEYKPKPDLAFRFEADNLVPFKFWRNRTIYTGERDAAPVDYHDYRAIQSQPRLFLRIRKTL